MSFIYYLTEEYSCHVLHICIEWPCKVFEQMNIDNKCVCLILMCNHVQDVTHLSISILIDFAVTVYPGQLTVLSVAVLLQLQGASESRGFVERTRPGPHLGHKSAPAFVPNSVGSAHLLHAQWKNLLFKRCSRRFNVLCNKMLWCNLIHL